MLNLLDFTVKSFKLAFLCGCASCSI